MPTYDYLCSQCKQQFEACHKMNALSPSCPECGCVANKIFLSAPSMHGNMARGRDLAMHSLEPKPSQQKHIHGSGCGCGHNHDS